MQMHRSDFILYLGTPNITLNLGPPNKLAQNLTTILNVSLNLTLFIAIYHLNQKMSFKFTNK